MARSRSSDALLVAHFRRRLTGCRQTSSTLIGLRWSEVQSLSARPDPLGAVLAAPSWEQAGYLAAFLVALATRRMLPALGAGLVIVSAVTLLRG